MIFKNIFSFPSVYKERNKEIKELQIFLIDVKIVDNKIIIESNCNGYNQTIEFQKNIIKPSTHIKIFCSCSSFKYEFASVLKKYDSLYNDNLFVNKLPKEKNPYRVICGCKHLIKFAEFIKKNINMINRRLNINE